MRPSGGDTGREVDSTQDYIIDDQDGIKNLGMSVSARSEVHIVTGR
jgi:hypothetical protein